jgi:hypothetical protein
MPISTLMMATEPVSKKLIFSSAMVHRISRENFAAHFVKLGG